MDDFNVPVVGSAKGDNAANLGGNKAASRVGAGKTVTGHPDHAHHARTVKHAMKKMGHKHVTYHDGGKM